MDDLPYNFILSFASLGIKQRYFSFQSTICFNSSAIVIQKLFKISGRVMRNSTPYKTITDPKHCCKLILENKQPFLCQLIVCLSVYFTTNTVLSVFLVAPAPGATILSAPAPCSLYFYQLWQVTHRTILKCGNIF